MGGCPCDGGIIPSEEDIDNWRFPDKEIKRKKDEKKKKKADRIKKKEEEKFKK